MKKIKFLVTSLVMIIVFVVVIITVINLVNRPGNQSASQNINKGNPHTNGSVFYIYTTKRNQSENKPDAVIYENPDNSVSIGKTLEDDHTHFQVNPEGLGSHFLIAVLLQNKQWYKPNAGYWEFDDGSGHMFDKSPFSIKMKGSVVELVHLTKFNISWNKLI